MFRKVEMILLSNINYWKRTLRINSLDKCGEQMIDVRYCKLGATVLNAFWMLTRVQLCISNDVDPNHRRHTLIYKSRLLHCYKKKKMKQQPSWISFFLCTLVGLSAQDSDSGKRWVSTQKPLNHSVMLFSHASSLLLSPCSSQFLFDRVNHKIKKQRLNCTSVRLVESNDTIRACRLHDTNLTALFFPLLAR